MNPFQELCEGTEFVNMKQPRSGLRPLLGYVCNYHDGTQPEYLSSTQRSTVENPGDVV